MVSRVVNGFKKGIAAQFIKISLVFLSINQRVFRRHQGGTDKIVVKIVTLIVETWYFILICHYTAINERRGEGIYMVGAHRCSRAVSELPLINEVVLANISALLVLS